MLSHPLLVVAIPAYNEARYLERTISSLLSQTWRDFAVLICDNASTDRTGEIARAAAERDPRVHYVRHETNIGAVGNFNYALDATDSQFFMWLGAHDMITPNFLERNLSALTSNDRLSVSHSLTGWIDEHDYIYKKTCPIRPEVSSRSRLIRYLSSAQNVGECTAINSIIRRSALNNARFDEIAGTDRMLISHILYNGSAQCTEGSLYLAREPAGKRDDYMKRLSGKDNVEKDRTKLIPVYLGDFDELTWGRWSRAWARPILYAILHKRFGPKPASTIIRMINRVFKIAMRRRL